MITRVETLNYRCLRYVERPLGRMHVLVGPNASGKTTFLDVISFLGALVGDGLEAAVAERTRNPLDLFWERKPGVFELALEARIPQRFMQQLGGQGFDTVRYEIQIAADAPAYEPEIRAERASLWPASQEQRERQLSFPSLRPLPDSVLSGGRRHHRRRAERGAPLPRTILNKVPGGNDNFYSEVDKKSGKGWAPSIKLGARRSTLGNLFEDESRFPVTTWLKTLLKEGVQKIVLNSLLIRQASPPGQGRVFKPDGSNLPWVVDDLIRKAPDNFRQWINHLSTALPDLKGIRVVEREDDRHSYLVIQYQGGLEVPSWTVSDGTLRLLALTVLAYLPTAQGIYLIEEPENGIHPTAVETVYQSLSSVYEGQVLVATHSPIMLAIAEPGQILCFGKAPGGATDIVSGREHPALRDWRGEVSLGDLFASGILG